MWRGGDSFGLRQAGLGVRRGSGEPPHIYGLDPALEGSAAAEGLDEERGNIVALMRLADEHPHFFEQRFDDRLTRCTGTGMSERSLDRFRSEQLATDIHGFRDAIGI